MSGLGWRKWTRERLAADTLQGYIQDQVTQVYASRSARDAILGTNATEGMVSYLVDEKALEVYADGGWDAPGGHTIAYVATGTGGGAVVQTSSTGGAEERVTTAALNFATTLRAGRMYRIEAQGQLNPNVANQNMQLLARGRLGAVPVATVSTEVAFGRYTSPVAGGNGRVQALIAGRFTVPTTGSYQFALFLVGASVSLLTDGRGLVDVSINDAGPAPAGRFPSLIAVGSS